MAITCTAVMKIQCWGNTVRRKANAASRCRRRVNSAPANRRDTPARRRLSSWACYAAAAPDSCACRDCRPVMARAIRAEATLDLNQRVRSVWCDPPEAQQEEHSHA